VSRSSLRRPRLGRSRRSINRPYARAVEGDSRSDPGVPPAIREHRDRGPVGGTAVVIGGADEPGELALGLRLRAATDKLRRRLTGHPVLG
jgi:hypothetical protein